MTLITASDTPERFNSRISSVLRSNALPDFLMPVTIISSEIPLFICRTISSIVKGARPAGACPPPPAAKAMDRTRGAIILIPKDSVPQNVRHRSIFLH